MGRSHDEQVEEEIAANAPDVVEESLKEEDEQLVEVDLETGEFVPVEARPPSRVFEILGDVGRAISKFADEQGSAPVSFQAALDKYRRRESMWRVAFWVALPSSVVVGELVYPLAGVLILTLYGLYFTLVNLSGIGGTVSQLKQAVAYERQGGDPDAPTPPTVDGHVPGGGNYI